MPEVAGVADADLRVVRQPEEVAEPDGEVGSDAEQVLAHDRSWIVMKFVVPTECLVGPVEERRQLEVLDVGHGAEERPVHVSERNRIVGCHPPSGLRAGVDDAFKVGVHEPSWNGSQCSFHDSTLFVWPVPHLHRCGEPESLTGREPWKIAVGVEISGRIVGLHMAGSEVKSQFRTESERRKDL